MTLERTTQMWDKSEALSSWLQELQKKTLLFALPGLALVGIIILGSLQGFYTPLQSILTTAAIFALTAIIWKLRQWHYLIAASFLVLGGIALDLYVIAKSGSDVALVLLAIPVGLATLTISRAAGTITASLCTALLLFMPFPTLIDPAPTTQIITLIMLWSTFLMLWLTLNPLLTAVRWAWSSYEHSHILLEQARTTHVQLHETLEDLADANLQLTRLNRQAQGLRQVAEDERRAKQEFVANVSHELRTPLNMIVGFCEMITKAPETYGDVPRSLLADLAVVLRNGQHLSNLIDDVLDLSQIVANQMALSKQIVALEDIIAAVTVAVRPLFESKGLYLHTEISEDLPTLLCDRTRIHEVLLNLLSNAGRFTEQGGVKIHAHQQENNVIVSVQDTGPGIAHQDKSRIFRPFQQLDGSIRRRYGGTGLGLSISKSFVELHGGQMWMESEIGTGTTFFFSLPLTSPAPPEAPAGRWITPGWEYLQRTHPPRMPEVKLRPRLVISEPGQALHRLLSRYLDDMEIVSVPNLEHAIQEIHQVPAQALLINDIAVDPTLQQLNDHTDLPDDIPIIICTVPGIEQMTHGLGVFDYLVKPISQETLCHSLERLEHPINTILLVDDEPDALRLFRRMLLAADRGYQILRASNGQQAWAMLQAQPIDVILLDLMMPEMNGFQFLALKNQNAATKDIPVILISARDPLGQPIVSNAIAATRSHGLTAREILACLEALQQILGPPSLQADNRSNVAKNVS